MDFAIVRAIAAQELKIQTRSRWTLIFAGIFGVLALAISYVGLVTAGTLGFQSFTRTSASLLNLVLYLVPLIALVMGALSFTGEPGAAELLFSQPLSRTDVLAGRILGSFAALAAAASFGFGLAGIVIFLNVGPEGSAAYLAFVGLTLVLALIHVALGAAAAVLARKRARAFGYTLFVWFFFVLFYDLIVIGVAFLVPERTANLMIFLTLFGNPVDLVRVAALLSLGGTTIFGPAGAALLKFLGGTGWAVSALLAALVVWAAVPLLLAGWALRRQSV